MALTPSYRQPTQKRRRLCWRIIEAGAAMHATAFHINRVWGKSLFFVGDITEVSDVGIAPTIYIREY